MPLIETSASGSIVGCREFINNLILNNMDKEQLKQVIDKVVKHTFDSITNLFKNNDNSQNLTKLYFPKYVHGVNSGEIRVSEQELRQLFIEEFSKDTDVIKFNLRYSVETPTQGWYVFSEERQSNGRSGNFDLAIFKDGEIVSVIEFKAGNAQSYKTDLEKLTNTEEGDSLRFLVNILVGADKGTVKSIINKFPSVANGNRIVYLRFHSMNNPEFDKDFPTEYKY